MNIEKLQEIRDLLEELLKYCNAMNDEFGEYCLSLYNLGQSTDMMSADFLTIYLKELKITLNYIEQNTKWTVVKETVVNEYDELEWLTYG